MRNFFILIIIFLSFLVTNTNVAFSAVVSDTSAVRFLASFDGSDGSTTIPDLSTTNPKGNATCVGNAQIDTAVSDPFGSNSGCYLGDGTGDYAYWADDDDYEIFDSQTGNVTVSVWIKKAVTNDNTRGLISWGDSADAIPGGIWYINTSGSGGYNGYEAGMRIDDTSQFQFSQTPGWDTNWHHFALVKIGSVVALYVDGVQKGYDSSFSNQSGITSNLYVGDRSWSLGGSLNGYVEDFLIISTNEFSANPNAELSDTIDVPTSAWSIGASATYSQIVIVDI